MDGRRIRRVWKQVFELAWPVMAGNTFRTAMRTTDIIVTALFSPAAVVAIGLADLYARFPLRIGLGLGGGAIALSSQDTGAGATGARDEAVTQAICIGAIAGVPFILVGLLLGESAIAAFGASDNVVQLGSTYLAIIFATAPARHIALIGARVLQGTGDTRTPMYINIVGNSLNLTGSAVLGLGLFGAPRLEIIGVGIATASANVLIATLLLVAISCSWTDASFARSRDWTIAKQLIQLSAPRVVEGLGAELAQFPFNALLLGFGEVVNAGFQIGRRVYQQVTGPLSRAYNVAASVLVGQSLGEGDAETASFDGWAVTALGVVTAGGIGIALVIFAEPIVTIFTTDDTTARFAVNFTRVYGLTAVALVAFSALSGALQGASETRIPFFARTSGMFVFFLGVSWLLGRTLNYGPVGAYVGVFLAYLWMALVTSWGFAVTRWADRATVMMAERGTAAVAQLESNDSTPPAHEDGQDSPETDTTDDPKLGDV